ncbi:replication-relaxation family protein [Bacillus sp. AG4(2022)]|uniref:replication-relaxation family protein n=1 Tax=Bacillus sp. AG4(2022) TaxID=2962594 RepID=UPI0028813A05|nr:replication-relaxation family protein [Bacillus sp. AG4(2022)]MDT0163810.1 replication-relaxation family protein [Bacillus sp. AG4(2022)]
MNTDRIESILTVIDNLGIVSVKQLHHILKLGSYRHTCRVISQLEPYLNVVRSNHKIVYLNKDGRQFIDSDKEIKKSIVLDHMLLANQAFIHYGCPKDWKREYSIQIEQKPRLNFGIEIKGLTVTGKKIVIPDAVFTQDWYNCLVEIDNTRTMQDNRKKLNKYVEMWEEIKKHFGTQVKLCIFTNSETRKKEFVQLCGSLPHEVWTFQEI